MYKRQQPIHVVADLGTGVSVMLADTAKNANAHKQNKDVVEITAWGAKVRDVYKRQA